MRPGTRKLRDVIIGVVLMITTLELTSLALVTFELKQPVARLRERRSWVAHGQAAAEPRITTHRVAADPIVPHPYVGFVYATLIGPDRHGFFGDDILKYSGPEHYNVVIVGGSVAANFAIELDRLIAERLGQFREARGKKVNVFSFAVGGWHQPQQLTSVAYFLGLGAQIDFLINLDGINEAFIPPAQAQASYSIYYPRDWPALTSAFTDAETRANLGWLELARRWRVAAARAIETAPLRSSVTAVLFWHLSDSVVEERTQSLLRQLQQTDRLMPYQVGYFRPLPESEVFERMANVWATSSKVLADLQRARGTRYLHVLQPHPYVPNAKPFTPAERAVLLQADGQLARWAREGYRHFLDRRRFLAENGVPFFDATMVFRDVREDLYRDCCHFNRRGDEILLEAMLGYAVDTGLLSPVTSPRTAPASLRRAASGAESVGQSPG